MKDTYIIPHAWNIIEEGFDPERVEKSESIFSLGNGYMGQRANFEETYTGPSLQGSYLGGIYYPDKTRVGWWKIGYPEYFAKVPNSPNWIGIDVEVSGEKMDLYKGGVSNFKRVLNMKEGWLDRTFEYEFDSGKKIEVKVRRFLSMKRKEVGVIKYSIRPLNFSGEIKFSPYIDAGIKNRDANYDEFFWKVNEVIESQEDEAYIWSNTLKTEFHVYTGMVNSFFLDGKKIQPAKSVEKEEKKITYHYIIPVGPGQTLELHKLGGYVHSMNHPVEKLFEESKRSLKEALDAGYEKLLEEQKEAWAKIWETSDIEIEGDVKAQQGIRFNIFQLNQTYTGEDPRLNIGPKGFTGEKYGGSTYWDTEAYCVPFYLGTKEKEVVRNLLLYRYRHLPKAIENAKKLGFTNGAALYPMVTMNGEECHNEWEITFEEIHRNGAIVYAIYNYVNYTGDYEYIPRYGMEVMIAVSRFWAERFTFSKDKKKYVMLGVTGPNEYENNVNNNWYTNYIAKWTLDYTIENLNYIKSEYPADYQRIIKKTNFSDNEIEEWKKISSSIYFPWDEERKIFLQQDGFLDKVLEPVNTIPREQRPINQHWSWDRILRSCFIKQADVLQGMYFFENHFDKDFIRRHFDFYEPMTVHESSLSPCVHSILASALDKDDKAYEMYLRTSRLDLDDYNKEVHEGLHITSMAGTWMSVVQGFGGMRTFNNDLSFAPKIPKEWKSLSFKIIYRGSIIKVTTTKTGSIFENFSEKETYFKVYNKPVHLKAHEKTFIPKH